MSTLRILRWADHPGLAGCASCNPKGPYQRQTGAQSHKRRCDDGGRGRSEMAMSQGMPIDGRVKRHILS